MCTAIIRREAREFFACVHLCSNLTPILRHTTFLAGAMNICSRRIWVPLRIPTRQQIQSIYQIRQYTSLGGRKIKFDRRDDERLKALTTWQNRLTLKTFPREVCSVTFSRSSGPGGQNVNKLLVFLPWN